MMPGLPSFWCGLAQAAKARAIAHTGSGAFQPVLGPDCAFLHKQPFSSNSSPTAERKLSAVILSVPLGRVGKTACSPRRAAQAAKASGQQKADDDGKKVKPPSGALADVAEVVAGAATTVDLLSDLHALMRDSFSKGDFAASVFERVAAGEDVTCPKYIADALAWLQDELEPDVSKTL